ncbi:hypothetical protein ES703_92524 [subsurface metagenome]
MERLKERVKALREKKGWAQEDLARGRQGKPAQGFDVREEKGMREEKEIREALKRLKDEHLGKARDPDSYSPPMLVGMISTLEWVLGDKKRLPDFV